MNEERRVNLLTDQDRKELDGSLSDLIVTNQEALAQMATLEPAVAAIVERHMTELRTKWEQDHARCLDERECDLCRVDAKAVHDLYTACDEQGIPREVELLIEQHRASAGMIVAAQGTSERSNLRRAVRWLHECNEWNARALLPFAATRQSMMPPVPEHLREMPDDVRAVIDSCQAEVAR